MVGFPSVPHLSALTTMAPVLRTWPFRLPRARRVVRVALPEGLEAQLCAEQGVAQRLEMGDLIGKNRWTIDRKIDGRSGKMRILGISLMGKTMGNPQLYVSVGKFAHVWKFHGKTQNIIQSYPIYGDFQGIWWDVMISYKDLSDLTIKNGEINPIPLISFPLIFGCLALGWYEYYTKLLSEIIAILIWVKHHLYLSYFIFTISWAYNTCFYFISVWT